MANRITQDAAETLETQDARTRITQSAAETLETAVAAGRITQSAAEALLTSLAHALVTQSAVEVLMLTQLLWDLDLGAGFSLRWQGFSGPFPWDIDSGGGFSLSWSAPPASASWSLDLGSRASLAWTPALQGFWTMALGSSFSLAFTPTVGATVRFWDLSLPGLTSLSWNVHNVQPNGWRLDLGGSVGVGWVVDSGATGGGCLSPPAALSRIMNYVF